MSNSLAGGLLTIDSFAGKLTIDSDSTTASQRLVQIISDEGSADSTKLSVFANGDVKIGDVNNETIELNADGSASFASGGIQWDEKGRVIIKRTDGRDDANTFIAKNAADEDTVSFLGNGNATFRGDITVAYADDANLDTSYGVKFYTEGNATQRRGQILIDTQVGATGTSKVLRIRRGATTTWSVTADGVVGTRGIELELEPDNPANYTTTTEEYEDTITGPGGKIEKTVTRTREIKTYTGPVLDVKTELQALRERATQQDAVIAEMTKALRELGKEVASMPTTGDEEPPAQTKTSRKRKS